MNEKLNPTTVHPPLGKYSHSVKVAPDAEWVVVAGQVGIDRNGKLARGVEKQTERAFRNILACLKANGMSKDDLVKTTVFLTDSRYVADFRAGRDKIVGDSGPASTLLIVAGLAAPEILVEIEAVAARAP